MLSNKVLMPVTRPVKMADIAGRNDAAVPAWRTDFKGMGYLFRQQQLHIEKSWLQSSEFFQRSPEAEDAIRLALRAFEGGINPEQHCIEGYQGSFVLSACDLEDLAMDRDNEALERAHSVEYEFNDRKTIVGIRVKDKAGKIIAALEDKTGTYAFQSWRKTSFQGMGEGFQKCHPGLALDDNWLKTAKLSPSSVEANKAMELAIQAFQMPIDASQYTTISGRNSSRLVLDDDWREMNHHGSGKTVPHAIEYGFDDDKIITSIKVKDEKGKVLASLHNPASASNDRQTFFQRGIAQVPEHSRFINIPSEFVSKPENDWLLKDPTHTNIVVPPQHMTNARRMFQQMLEQSGKRVMYIPDAYTLEELKTDLALDGNKPTLADGPVKQLMESGGVILLNVAGFTPQQMEALNSLMEEQLWEGKKLPHPVKVVCFTDADMLKQNRLSGAQISRTAFRDLSTMPFPKIPDLPIDPAREYDETQVPVIDLEHDPQWRKVLFGGPVLGEDQQWQDKPAAMPARDYKGLVVIRNVPADPLLMDELLSMKNKGMNIVLESGLPPSIAKERLSTKQPANDIGTLLQDPASPVCIATMSTMDELLNAHFGARDGKPIRVPSVLQQVQKLHSHRRPCVYVTESLPPSEWDRLMLHPSAFEVAAAPGVMVPENYRAKVAVPQAGVPANTTDAMDIDEEAPAGNGHSRMGKGVEFEYSLDPTLADRDRALKDRDMGNEPATRLFVTPSMRGDSLLHTLRREQGRADVDDVANFSFHLETHQLINDLKAGKHVILRDLETNPGLVSDLAPLLHGGCIHINGERLHFGAGGGLTGKLTVMTGSEELLKHHALAKTVKTDTTETQWQQHVVSMLKTRFPELDSQVESKVEKLLGLFRIMANQGIIENRKPPINYATLESIFQHLFTVSAERMHEDDRSRKQERLIRSLFKDILIGDYRDTSRPNDPQYAYLKTGLRLLFSEEMEMMPQHSVDSTRLQELLKRVNHVSDIRRHAWTFLNAFSADVIEKVVGEKISGSPRQRNSKEIADKVVALVLDQASQHGWPLDGLLAGHLRGLKDDKVIKEKLSSYQRPAKMDRSERAEMKTKLLFDKGTAAFFKGPPGAGKTHAALQITEDSTVFHANIGEEGSSSFDDALEAWAESMGPATLIIDEANLAGKDRLGMLKSVFADGTLYVKGRVHSLSPDHRILFTGNSDKLAGRNAQQVAKESIPTQQHKAILRNSLGAIFIRPLVEKLTDELAVPQRDALAYIEKQILDIHDHMQQAFPELSLSPRNLEEMAAQVLSMLAMSKETHAPEDIAPFLARMAMNVYTPELAAEDKTAVATWLMNKLGEQSFRQPGSLPGSAPSIPQLPDVALEAGMALTPSTQTLANDIAWWLNTQKIRNVFNHKDKVLGQRALMIEGPASRGKDTVVEAVLKHHQRDFVHLNANPNNLDELRKTLEDAQKTGKVLVISEANILPSNVLESLLNSRLTGDDDTALHPNFGLILTTNPIEYAGRQPMSEALKNRMQIVSLETYLPEELTAIATSIAGDIAQPAVRRNSQMPPIPQDKIDELVRLHRELLEKMNGISSEFQPGIRQLRNALKLMYSQPTQDVKAIFKKMYAFYITRAQLQEEGNRRNSRLADKAYAKALGRALSLSHPDWLSLPRLIPTDPSRLAGKAFSFNAKEHTVSFDKSRPLDELCMALLNQTGTGLYGDDAHVEEAVANEGVPETPPAPETAKSKGVSFSPTVGTSGVGSEDIEGYIGKFFGNEEKLLLATSRLSLRNELLRDRRDPLSNATPANPRLPRVELTDVKATKDVNPPRVYLPVPLNMRPTEVTLDGARAGSILVDENGGYYVNTDKDSIDRLRYGFVEASDRRTSGKDAQLGRLDLDVHPELKQEIGRIKDANLPPAAIVDRLSAFFKTSGGFEYSREDAEALDATANNLERVQRFLTERKGVCYEFSRAFAALLEECGVSSRLVNGFVGGGKEKNIRAQKHAWIEYLGNDGKWHSSDPTTLASNTDGESIPRLPAEPTGGINRRTRLWVHEHMVQSMPLGRLGLVNWSMKNEGSAYSTYGGTLDIKRMLAGNPRCFRTNLLKATETPLPLYITEFPIPEAGLEERNRFMARVMFPLQALIERKVPVYIKTENGFQQISQAWQLADLRPSEEEHPLPRHGEAKVVDAGHAEFFEELISRFYESFLPMNLEKRDVEGAFLNQWGRFPEWIGALKKAMPLTLTIHGQKFEIDQDAFENQKKHSMQQMDAMLSQLGKSTTAPAFLQTATMIRNHISIWAMYRRVNLLGENISQMTRQLNLMKTSSIRGAKGVFEGWWTELVRDLFHNLPAGWWVRLEPAHATLLNDELKWLTENATNAEARKTAKDILAFWEKAKGVDPSMNVVPLQQ